MSLVPVYCKCTDGMWYKDPVWRGYDEDGKERWFLVLDDDEDPEMVLNVSDYPENVPKKERAAKFPVLDFVRYTSLPSGFNGQWRMFTGTFTRASNRSCEFTKVPPPPRSYSKKFTERPSGECRFYDLERYR